MRTPIVLALLASFAASAFVVAVATGYTSSGTDGRIAFAREVPPGSDETFTYTANSDGTNLKRLFTNGPSGEPRWSPDGRRVAVLAGCTDGSENCAFTIVDADTRRIRQVKMRDPGLMTGCTVWSPDGRRFACEGFGEPDATRNGIYTLRTSDGGELVRVTTNHQGFDTPGDYSPRGTHLVFARFGKDDRPLGLFVVRSIGGEVRRITPPGTIHSSPGDWSPSGNRIIFARRVNTHRHNSLWVVRSDGSGLRELRLQGAPPCGGSISSSTARTCIHPRWSPDGRKIIFGIVRRKGGGGEIENVYIANADGTGVTQITRGGGDEAPDWGRTR
jgi:Tol biopolymer transport system component